MHQRHLLSGQSYHLQGANATNNSKALSIILLLCSKGSHTDYVPKNIEARHDADEQHLRSRANEPMQQIIFIKTYEESQYFAIIKEPEKHDQTGHS